MATLQPLLFLMLAVRVLRHGQETHQDDPKETPTSNMGAD